MFQQGERFYTLVKSAKRPVAAIVSTSKQRFYQNLFHQLTLTLPLGSSVALSSYLCGHDPGRHITHRVDCCNGPLPHQLCLHYQPIIDIRNGTCVGAEALLRWPGYHGPVMSPCEFIPLAEKEG